MGELDRGGMGEDRADQRVLSGSEHGDPPQGSLNHRGTGAFLSVCKGTERGSARSGLTGGPHGEAGGPDGVSVTYLRQKRH